MGVGGSHKFSRQGSSLSGPWGGNPKSQSGGKGSQNRLFLLVFLPVFPNKYVFCSFVANSSIMCTHRIPVFSKYSAGGLIFGPVRGIPFSPLWPCMDEKYKNVFEKMLFLYVKGVLPEDGGTPWLAAISAGKKTICFNFPLRGCCSPIS